MLTLIHLVSVMVVLLVLDGLFSMMARRRSISLTTLGPVVSPSARMMMVLLSLAHLSLFPTSSPVGGNSEVLRIFAHGCLTLRRRLEHLDVVLRFAQTDKEFGQVLQQNGVHTSQKKVLIYLKPIHHTIKLILLIIFRFFLGLALGKHEQDIDARFWILLLDVLYEQLGFISLHVHHLVQVFFGHCFAKSGGCITVESLVLHAWSTVYGH